MVLVAIAAAWVRRGRKAVDAHADLRRQLETLTGERQQLTAALEAARAAQASEANVGRLLHEMREQLFAQQQTSLVSAAALLEQRAESHSNVLRQAVETEAQRRMETLQSELAPVRRGLSDLARQLAESRTAAATEITEFGAMLRRVTEEQSQHRDDTRQLHRALRTSHVRGLYGELTLQRTLEHAGLEEGLHFLVQPTERDEDGGMRPDVILLLPRQRCVVVDSKAPLETLVDLMASTDPKERVRLAQQHARQVRVHIDALAARQYTSRLRAAEGVTAGFTMVEATLLFLPSQPALDVALKHDPALLTHAFSKNVFLVTPTTLLLAVGTVSQIWRHERLTENSHEILRLAGELHDRVVTLVRHLTALRRGINQTVQSFNRLTASLETRVLPSARRLRTLGVSTQREISATKEIDVQPRVPSERLLALAAEVDDIGADHLDGTDRDFHDCAA
ncbi:DNA recombination protein RmuC [Gemmatimonas sp.]|uniref:DNA recombination protein RmuC n=1 Tax=Gemmatimonas sp. TaxID=1962908 RepID=UPI0025B85BD7|nr:DNA recombination protein RmuC [Gemmatimonas sp.]MCA2992501.1 DNA recombination protein RmuC [Gemmatimonas sp.]